jgi:hypothetical protein
VVSLATLARAKPKLIDSELNQEKDLNRVALARLVLECSVLGFERSMMGRFWRRSKMYWRKNRNDCLKSNYLEDGFRVYRKVKVLSRIHSPGKEQLPGSAWGMALRYS